MTDQVQAQSIPEAPQLDQAQFNAIKESLLQNFMSQYTEFTSKLSRLPVQSLAKSESFKHFDTGFLWFKESIIHMPMPEVKVMQQAPQSDAADQPIAPQEAESTPEAAETTA